ncbi:MAG: RdgB/HAM1 family non-canonical purine NTP pyrophosphatase [Synergistaceae bacterium]|nr:RdgB/HAM1 family non-canonical purine NTP pyrophosphatase [Synergistaceae bacterium]
MKIDKIVIATGNAGKFKEFQEMARGFVNELIFAPEIAELVVEETGRTYSENAMLKASAWAKCSGLPCLADDSGLEVNALDGAPGLFSARIVKGPNDNKVSWLLEALHDKHDKSDRAARFAASLALCVPDDYVLICEGFCYGTIANAPSGDNGFGYDPVFIPDGYDKTFAELDPVIKNSISHRYNAFKKLVTVLNLHT